MDNEEICILSVFIIIVASVVALVASCEGSNDRKTILQKEICENIYHTNAKRAIACHETLTFSETLKHIKFK